MYILFFLCFTMVKPRPLPLCCQPRANHEAPAKHESKGYEKSVLTRFDVKQAEFNDFQPHDPHAESRVHQFVLPRCLTFVAPLLACPGFNMSQRLSGGTVQLLQLIKLDDLAQVELLVDSAGGSDHLSFLCQIRADSSRG